MKNLVTPFKVGLVVLIAIAAAILMSRVVDDSTSDETFRVSVLMADATGLSKQGRVQMAGIKVGELEDIELKTTDDAGNRLPEAKAKITLILEKSKAYPLREGVQKDGAWVNGATVSKRQAGIVGDFFLDLTPGIAGEVIEDGGLIHIVPETGGIGEVMSKMSKIADDISKVTNSLANTFGSAEGEASLKNIINRLDEISTTLADFLKDNKGNFDSIVVNAEETTANVNALTRDARVDLRKISRDVQKITGDVRNIVSNSGDDVQEGLGNLKGVLARLQTTLDTLNYSLQNVSEITDTINSGEGTLGQLVNDPTIADETEAILTDAGDFIERIVELKTIVELRSEYLFRQAALKNYVSIRLQPNPSKYYLIELIDDPRGRRRLLQTTTLSTNPADPNVVREEQVITTDDFKFSAQIAKRWNFFTGRFGLIETTGGVGGDLHFLDDQLEIKMDAFDFGEDVNPRIRTAFAYTFFQYIYIIAGTDDILNDETRDFFFGASLRFNDEDLKSLISTSGIPSF